MTNSNNEENTFDNQTQNSSPYPTSSSQNEACEPQDMIATQTPSQPLKRRYCKNADKKLKEYFEEENIIDLSTDSGLPRILCDDDIAEKIGVSRWAVYAHRRKHHIPDRDARMDCALKTLFTVARESFKSVKNFQRLLVEQKLNEPLPTGIVVPVTAGVTAVVTFVFFALVYLLFL